MPAKVSQQLQKPLFKEPNDAKLGRMQEEGELEEYKVQPLPELVVTKSRTSKHHAGSSKKKASNLKSQFKTPKSFLNYSQNYMQPSQDLAKICRTSKHIN